MMRDIIKNHREVPHIYAGLLSSMVEGVSLDEALEIYGASIEDVITNFYSKKSSPEAIEYTRQLMLENALKYKRAKGEELFLVKKVICPNDYFEQMEKDISKRSNKKFKVLRIIGSNPLGMKYKQNENAGIEFYLETGKNGLEAMNKTSEDSPIFNSSGSLELIDYLGEFDKVVTKAIYVHSPKEISKIFDFFG